MKRPVALRWSLRLAGASAVSVALAPIVFSQSSQTAILPGETSVLVSLKRLNEPAIDPRIAMAPGSNRVSARLVADQGELAQALAEGPVHEAFAEPVSVSAAPGQVVPQQPPDPINENPPEYRPNRRNLNWIPGYWAWLENQQRFAWVSGLWRSIPPGRDWVPGHWADVDGGYQWVNGFWGDVSDQQLEYLPHPPESLEQGPTTDAPSDNHFWIPGYWKLEQQHYTWQSGYWSPGQEGWTWVPTHYVHTPSGAVLVSGYWDYPLQQRGLLYAPVYWNEGYRPGSEAAYTPSRVVNSSMLLNSLHVENNTGHYYFGQGHSNRDGYHPWYEAGEHGYYSPFYGYYAWQYGRDSNQWKHRFNAASNQGNAHSTLPSSASQTQHSYLFGHHDLWGDQYRVLTSDERSEAMGRTENMEQFRSARSAFESQQRLDPQAHLTRYFDDDGHPRGAYSYVVNDYEPSAFRLKNSSAAEQLRHQARNQHEFYRQQVELYNLDNRNQLRHQREESDHLRDDFKRQVDESYKQQLHDHNRVKDQIDHQHELIGEMKVEQRDRMREMQSESRRRTARPHEEHFELDHQPHGSFGRRGP